MPTSALVTSQETIAISGAFSTLHLHSSRKTTPQLGRPKMSQSSAEMRLRYYIHVSCPRAQGMQRTVPRQPRVVRLNNVAEGRLY